MTMLRHGFAVFIATIYLCSGSDASNDKDFDVCLTELGMQEISLDDLDRKPAAFPCLLACIYEKTGVMAFGKIKINRYIENYVESLQEKPNNFSLIRTKLIECATNANKQRDKCMVADYTRKCEADYQEILFP